MKKIGFVILHYLAIEDTIKCINSIIDNIDTKNYEIIIIDNNSNNNTGVILQKKYKNSKKIHVLLNKTNLGFSKGNNVGFRYAKNDLKCDFICMMNNDTYLIQKDFFEVILSEFENSNFSVLGPEIHLKNNEIQCVRKNIPTIKEEQAIHRMIILKLIKNYCFIESIEIIAKNIIKKLINYQNKCNYIKEKRVENPVLHGCCLIFSPIYISKFDGLDEKTFLYGEEEFLAIKLKSNNLLSVYNPKLKIFHSEDKSTIMLNKKNYKKRRFVYKYCLIAQKLIIEELKKLV